MGISVYLPLAAEFGVTALVVNETVYIFDGIAEKQSRFMGETTSFVETLFQEGKHVVQAHVGSVTILL